MRSLLWRLDDALPVPARPVRRLGSKADGRLRPRKLGSSHFLLVELSGVSPLRHHRNPWSEHMEMLPGVSFANESANGSVTDATAVNSLLRSAHSFSDLAVRLILCS